MCSLENSRPCKFLTCFLLEKEVVFDTVLQRSNEERVLSLEEGQYQGRFWKLPTCLVIFATLMDISRNVTIFTAWLTGYWMREADILLAAERKGCVTGMHSVLIGYWLIELYVTKWWLISPLFLSLLFQLLCDVHVVLRYVRRMSQRQVSFWWINQHTFLRHFRGGELETRRRLYAKKVCQSRK